jgi:hypothetical protein
MPVLQGRYLNGNITTQYHFLSREKNSEPKAYFNIEVI